MNKEVGVRKVRQMLHDKLSGAKMVQILQLWGCINGIQW